MNQKTALVTGASRGIGKALALRLSKDGYHILLHYACNEAAAQQTADEITSQGGTVQLLQADLTNTDQTASLIKQLPPVDVLVLNASTQIRMSWDKITVADAQLQLNSNFVSSMMLMQAVADHMKQQNWGRIVAISSVQEAKPHPDMLVYSASKAAQSNMAKSLALQLASYNITVNNVCPGVIYTDRNMEALADPEYAAQVRASIPVGFYGEPQDCAGIVSLLCSEEARYITGQTIYVDGGKSIQ